MTCLFVTCSFAELFVHHIKLALFTLCFIFLLDFMAVDPVALFDRRLPISRLSSDWKLIQVEGIIIFGQWLFRNAVKCWLGSCIFDDIHSARAESASIACSASRTVADQVRRSCARSIVSDAYSLFHLRVPEIPAFSHPAPPVRRPSGGLP